jgi:hypothetical protein
MSLLLTHANQLSELLRKYRVKSYLGVVRELRTNHQFAREWKHTWGSIGRSHGGKVALGTAGTIIGAAFGSVGIAAFGGAIGVPLALVLGLGGIIVGAGIDATRGNAVEHIPVAPLDIRGAPELPSARDGARELFGISADGGPARFDKEGWFYVGTAVVPCPTCATYTEGFRKPYKTSAGDKYFYWALLCLPCERFWAPDDLSAEHRKTLYASSKHRPRRR